jgi:hypothetical protein
MEENQDKNQVQEDQQKELSAKAQHSLWSACRYIIDHPGCSKSDLQKHLKVVYPHGQIGAFMWMTWPRNCGFNCGEILKSGQLLTGTLETLDYLKYNPRSVKGMRRGLYILPRGKEFAAGAEPAHTWSRPDTVPTLWLEDNCEIGMLVTCKGRTRGVFLHKKTHDAFVGAGHMMPGEFATLVSLEDRMDVVSDHMLRKYGRSYPTATVTILHANFGLCQVYPNYIKPAFNNKRKGGKHVNQ